MSDISDILFDEIEGKGGCLGIITLNRPQSLNSLTHHMITAMKGQLDLWAKAAHIKVVIIRAAEGRAFCAGGDLRLIYDRKQNQEEEAVSFFRDEYQLNRLIFHYPKA